MVILVRRKLKDLCLILFYVCFSLCVCASVYTIHSRVLTEGITYYMEGVTLWPGHLGYGISTWVLWKSNFWAMSLAAQCPIFEGHKAWTLSNAEVCFCPLSIFVLLFPNVGQKQRHKQHKVAYLQPTSFRKPLALLYPCHPVTVGRCSYENAP